MNTADNPTFPWRRVYDEIGISEEPFDDRPLGVCVEEYAKKISKNIAFHFFDTTISYGELNEYANKFANVLTTLGVKKTDVVGIHMPNIPQYIIAVIAISKIGCAGSGVSPLLSPLELAYQIEDTGISVMISLDTLAAGFGKIKTLPPRLKTIIITGFNDHISPQPMNVIEVPGCSCEKYINLMRRASTLFKQRDVHWNDTFMIQYTGGTTGKPKGAELSVRNLLYNTIQATCFTPMQIGEEIMCSPFPMFHMAGLTVALQSLCFGAQFILIPDPRNIEFICTQLAKVPPTRIYAVPTLYRMLLDFPDFKKINFSPLKMAVTGAAPLPQVMIEELEAVIGKNKLSDFFGMTETSPVHLINPPTRYKPGSVGVPVPGGETRIVDIGKGQKELHFGEVGEIITSGPHVMKGYLNQPEETQKAIREFRDKRWMYTGDVGFMDEEGYIYLCDRAKDMLIVGGYKVFSVEVEEKLQHLDFIAESALVGKPDEERPGNDTVILYIELTEGHKRRDHDEVKNEVIKFFRETMAPYKRPKVIHIIDKIPLTSVGKIDKKALRK